MELPELFQLDERYRVAVLDADLVFVDDILARLRTGDLVWDREWIAQIAARYESAAES